MLGDAMGFHKSLMELKPELVYVSVHRSVWWSGGVCLFFEKVNPQYTSCILRNPPQSYRIPVLIHAYTWDAMGFLRMLGDAMGFHKSLMELKPGGVVYMKLTL